MARAGETHRKSPPAQQAPGARQSAPAREPAPAPVAGTPEQIVSESWTVRDAGDESGDVSSPCMVLALYETTRALSFALNRYDRFALTIDSPVWKIEKEMRYPVTISVDGRDIGKFRISGSGDGMYLINLPYTDRVVEGLKNGLRLGVTVKESTLLYSLAGIRVALTDLERCVAQGTEAAEDWRRNPHLSGRQSDTRSSAPLAAGGTAAPGAPDKMISGSWELETLYRKNSGKFSYCRIDADYESSRSLAFTLDHVDRFKIMIYDPRWKLKSDAPYPSTLSIDDRDIGDYEAKAVDGVLYMISLPYTDDIVDAFKHGRQVAIDVDGETLRFGLAGTLVGLTDLERCVAEGGEPAKGVRRNPYLNSQPAPVAAARPKSAGAETRPTAPVLDQGAQVRADRRRFFNSGADDDWAFVNRLLDSVGLWDFEYVPRDEEKRRPIFYRWTNHLVAGGIIYFSLGNGTAFDEVRSTIENHDKNCDGAFDHTIREVKMASGAKAWRVFGSCSKAGEREVIAFLAFAYEGTGIYVTHIGLEAETDAIRDADNRMFGWFQATF